MKKLTTRWYYSLKEAIDAYNEEYELGLAIGKLGVADGEGHIIGLSAIAQVMLGDNATWCADSEKAVEMFTKYLWPEMQDATVTYVDKLVNPWELQDEEEPEFEELEEEMNPILLRFIRWIVESQERYEVLINAYKSIENNLLAQVKTVSESEGLSIQSSDGVNASSVSDNGGSSVLVESVSHGSASSTNSGSESSTGTSSNSEESLSTATDSKVHLENDTPQASWSDGFAADPYVSKMTKDDASNRVSSGSESNGSTSTSGTSSSTGETANSAVTTSDTTTTSNNSSTINGSNSSSARGTNSQSSVVGSDVTTPIERLNEIRQKLHNLYVDWADEFSRFVIYSD